MAAFAAPCSRSGPRRQDRAPEPAWHRRARQQRSQDRMVARLAAALARLTRHHGSAAPRILRHLVPSEVAADAGRVAAEEAEVAKLEATRAKAAEEQARIAAEAAAEESRVAAEESFAEQARTAAVAAAEAARVAAEKAAKEEARIVAARAEATSADAAGAEAARAETAIVEAARAAAVAEAAREHPWKALFVSDLPGFFDREMMINIFGAYGTLVSERTRFFRGTEMHSALLTYSSVEEATSLLVNRNQNIHISRTMNIKFACFAGRA